MLQQLTIGEVGQDAPGPHLHSWGGSDARLGDAVGIELIPTRESHDLSAIPLRPGTYAMGSSSSCEIPVDRPGVAERHCTLIVGPRKTVVKAWSPLTWINDGAVVEGTLRVGDRLILGPVEYRVLELRRDAWAPVREEPEVVVREQPVVPRRIDPVEAIETIAALPPQFPNHPALSRKSEPAPGGHRLEAELLADLQELLDEFFQREKAFRSEVATVRVALDERRRDLETQSSALDFAQRHLRQEQERLRLLTEKQKLLDSRQAACEELRSALLVRERGLTDRETELADRAKSLAEHARGVRRRELDSRRHESKLEKVRDELEARARALNAQEQSLDIDSRFVASRQAEFASQDAALVEQSRALLAEQESLHEERLRLFEERQSWEVARQRQQAEFEDRELDWEARCLKLDAQEESLAGWEERLRRDSEQLEQRVQELQQAETSLSAQRLELAAQQTKLQDQQRNLEWELAEIEARQQQLDAREAELRLAAEQVVQRSEGDQGTFEIRGDHAEREVLAAEKSRLMEWEQRLELLGQGLDQRSSQLRDEAEHLKLLADELRLREQTLWEDREAFDRSRLDFEEEQNELSRVQMELRSMRDHLAVEQEQFSEERLAWDLTFRERDTVNNQLDSPDTETLQIEQERLEQRFREIQQREDRVAEMETLFSEEKALMEIERESLRLERERLECDAALIAGPAPSLLPNESQSSDAQTKVLDERESGLLELEAALRSFQGELEVRQQELEARSLRLDERQETLVLMARQLKEAKETLNQDVVDRYAMGDAIELPGEETRLGSIRDSWPGSPSATKDSSKKDPGKTGASAAGPAAAMGLLYSDDDRETGHLTYSGSFLGPWGISEIDRVDLDSQPVPDQANAGVELSSSKSPAEAGQDGDDQEQTTRVESPEEEPLEETKSEEVLVSRLRNELASMFGMDSRKFDHEDESLKGNPGTSQERSGRTSIEAPGVDPADSGESSDLASEQKKPASRVSEDESLEDSVSRYMERLLAKPAPALTESERQSVAASNESTALGLQESSALGRSKSLRKLRQEEKDAMRAGMNSFREIALISGRIAVAKSTVERLQVANKYLRVTTGISWGTTAVLAFLETFMVGSDYFTTMVAGGISVVMSLLTWKSQQEIRRLERVSKETLDGDDSNDDSPSEPPQPKGPINVGGLTYV